MSEQLCKRGVCFLNDTFLNIFEINIGVGSVVVISPGKQYVIFYKMLPI